MKKIILLLIIIGIYITFNRMIVYGEENIDLNLKNNEISITFVHDNILVTNNKNTFLILSDVNDDIKKFGKFDIININNVNIDLDYNIHHKLNTSLLIDNIRYEIKYNLIKIIYNDNTFCIYNNQNINIDNIASCNFLYLFNTKDINNIEVNEFMDIIFFNEKANMPTYFLEDIYSKWIDIYRLKDNEFVSLIINDEDYRIIVIPDE